MSDEEAWDTGEDVFGDEAVKIFREFIDTENHLIQEEHNLAEKLMAWQNLYGHLEEIIPENLSHLFDLNNDLFLIMQELVDITNDERLKELHLVKEEQHHIDKLSDDTKHKHWRAVRKLEKKSLRVEHHELKLLHTKFGMVMDIIKSYDIAVDKDLPTPEDKHKYVELEQKIHYYFIQTYKFAKAYEKIFRDLYNKEKKLFKKE